MPMIVTGQRVPEGAVYRTAASLLGVFCSVIKATGAASDPAHAGALAEGERELRRIFDPDAVSAGAFADQAARINVHDCLVHVLGRGRFSYTPAPRQKPAFA